MDPLARANRPMDLRALCDLPASSRVPGLDLQMRRELVKVRQDDLADVEPLTNPRRLAPGLCRPLHQGAPPLDVALPGCVVAVGRVVGKGVKRHSSIPPNIGKLP